MLGRCGARAEMNGLTLSRRSFIGAGLAACLPAVARSTRRVGVQLFTVRDIVLSRPAETLRAIAAMGYREVEVLRDQLVALAPHLKATGLRPVALHFETPLITGNWDAWKRAEMPPIVPTGVRFEDVIGLAHHHGVEYLVFNYLTPEERLGADFYRQLAEKLNSAAAQCHKAGMRFCYHNHDFEFEPRGSERPIDVLLAHLDPALVRLEVDTFWVSMAGIDAVAFLNANAGRVGLVHVKDRAPGTPRHYDIATVPQSTYRELGNGDLPIPQILDAAVAAGARHFFVEQDYSTDPLASLQQSYAYLRQIGFV
jgi:sugar phosphate isomerase/epimerase